MNKHSENFLKTFFTDFFRTYLWDLQFLNYVKHLSGSGSDSGSLTVLNMTNNELLMINTMRSLTWHDNWISGLLHFWLFFWKNDDFSTPILSLLSMCSHQLNKSGCNLARMSQPTQSGSTILADNDSPCVIHNIGTREAKFDAQSCEICPRKTGWKNWFGLSSRTLFTKTF